MEDDDIMAMAMGEQPEEVEFQAMSEEEFCAIIAMASDIARQENESGSGYEDRINSLAYYNGECPDLPILANRSRMVSNDLRAVVAKVQPGVMRTFFSSSKVVDYTSDALDDEKLVDVVETRINDDFMRGGGYNAFESAIFDCMIHDDGAITYDIRDGKVTFEAIPPENVLITPGARSEDGASLFGYWSRVTRSDLIERKFDPVKVQQASEWTKVDTGEDYERRVMDRDIDLGEQLEEIDCYNLFVQIDMDGDGIAELRHVVFVNDCVPETLLWNEKVDRRRIFLVKAENRPHSARGRGLFRDVMDIQRAKTALLRAAMDNIAAVNDPTTIVDLIGIENADDLLQRKRGAILLANGLAPGVEPLRTIQVPFTAANCFDAMKYYDMALIDRTGVSGAASGMLPDVLQGQTAAAVNMIQQGGTARVELICRNIAECTMRPMFEGIFLDLVEMTGLAVDLKDTSINVGLGAGTRERDMQALGQVMGLQEKLLAAYGSPTKNPFVRFKHIYNSLAKSVEVAGLRTPDAYFHNPTDQEVEAIGAEAANAPNPERDKLQFQMQIEDKKMAVQRDKEMAQAQADVAVKQAEMEKDAQAAQREDQRAMVEIEAKVMIEREKIASAEKIAFAKMQMDRDGAMMAAGQEVPMIDPETGVAQPTQSELMLQSITMLAEQVAAMQAVMSAPRVMTTPDGRQYTSSIATVN
jgi:hypothetical protein